MNRTPLLGPRENVAKIVHIQGSGATMPSMTVSRHHSYARRHAFALLPIDGNSANSDNRGRMTRFAGGISHPDCRAAPVIDFVTGSGQEFGMAQGNNRIRIGVTGHRPNQFPASGQDRVRAALPAAFAQLRSAVEANRGGGAGGFEPSSATLTVVSALAEGADRIVAAAGLVAGFDLAVILPFAAEEYERDFVSEESKAEFRALLVRAGQITVLAGQRAAGEDAYYRAGIVVLDESDAIIAVWDGEPAHGNGGTAAIVQEALRRALPVLRFKPDGSGPFDLGGRREPA